MLDQEQLVWRMVCYLPHFDIWQKWCQLLARWRGDYSYGGLLLWWHLHIIWIGSPRWWSREIIWFAIWSSVIFETLVQKWLLIWFQLIVFLFVSDACAIAEDYISVVLTAGTEDQRGSNGGWKSLDRVTRYFRYGTFEDLPNLLAVRRGHTYMLVCYTCPRKKLLERWTGSKYDF